MRALSIVLSECGPLTAASANVASGTRVDCLDLHFGNERVGCYGVPNAPAVARAINEALAAAQSETETGEVDWAATRETVRAHDEALAEAAAVRAEADAQAMDGVW